MSHDPLYYGDYLQLDKLLTCVAPESAKAGVKAHDEHLFIVIHQVYELWFKQILYELRSVCELFKSDYISEASLATAVDRLRRVVEIQRVLVEQLTVLETMSPVGFLEFRDFLYPASGFQSLQFRQIEVLLGLTRKKRLKYSGKHFCSYLNERDANTIRDNETGPSLYQMVERWLERTPFLEGYKNNDNGFSFLRTYADAVDGMFECDRMNIESQPGIPDEMKRSQLEGIAASKLHYHSILEASEHEKLLEKGERTLSHKATLAALLINVYQEEHILQLPFQLLTQLLNIDELLVTWRYRHALMVHRMLGVKIGTGGSSGYAYLRATASRHKIFKDLFNMSTYLVPRRWLPALPRALKKRIQSYVSSRAYGDVEGDEDDDDDQ